MVPPSSASVRLPNGQLVLVRPLLADDKPLLIEGFRRLSPRARYLRFLTATEELSRTQLAYLSELDFSDHVAWAVLDEGEPAAVGRFVRLRGDSRAADVAITVVDAHQRKGIGSMLIEALAEAARRRGIDRFHFDVLAENQGMLALLDRLGALRQVEDGLIHAVVDVDRIPTPDVVEGDLVPLLEAATRRAG